MNWIEIDKILCEMIQQHSSAEEIYQEACDKFKWDNKQARDAVDPLLKRHSDIKSVAKTSKKPSKRLRKK